jgi:hypothetical protein
VEREQGKEPPSARLIAVLSTARCTLYLPHSNSTCSRVSRAPHGHKRQGSSRLRTRFDAPKLEWSSQSRERRVA